ncbi:unnamed protein product [Fusarium venenatum]|uniref:Uncharacterized protein n=1 Tax=Fusarium venenatum TaxID=56646 RepID=A0A2L2U0V0_9HYPO|nr:uncharacterized protein FVRRES_08747 [Fusarium venenatum]CEI68670.1 unnamed protein product [Fusarium venenatum]
MRCRPGNLNFWKIATSSLLGSPLTRRVPHTDATIASGGLASPVGRVKTRSSALHNGTSCCIWACATEAKSDDEAWNAVEYQGGLA